jgi:hypothetical protein
MNHVKRGSVMKQENILDHRYQSLKIKATAASITVITKIHETEMLCYSIKSNLSIWTTPNK